MCDELKTIEINGGYPIRIMTFENRSHVAAAAAFWSADNAENAWCIGPDNLGGIEVTFANPDDVDRFGHWFFTGPTP